MRRYVPFRDRHSVIDMPLATFLVLRSNLPTDIGDPGRDIIRTLHVPQSWCHLSIAKATKPSNIDANKPLLLNAV
ncbi:hypothetical protein TNCV_99331 [Trichonephila clavipes]|nr:hypothetical protein TNCV_99331 [Trichonephila clavipes]